MLGNKISQLQTLIAVHTWSIEDLKALHKDLPRVIHLRELEAEVQGIETAKAEENVEIFGLTHPPNNIRGTRKPSPIGAQALIQKFLDEDGAANKNVILYYCQSINPTITITQFDSAASELVLKKIMIRTNGFWHKAA